MVRFAIAPIEKESAIHGLGTKISSVTTLGPAGTTGKVLMFTVTEVE